MSREQREHNPQAPVLFDTHAHLDAPHFNDDREEVLRRGREAGVCFIMTIGSGFGLESAGRAVEIAQSRANIWASAGIHPHDAEKAGEEELARLGELARGEKVKAIGETGLDYYKLYAGKDAQLKCFRAQLALARELDLPVVIHDREAHEDLLAALKKDGPPPAGGVMHCFSGDKELAREMVEMGFFISVPGVLTFRNARSLPEVVLSVPRERILLETDCPFLAPEPHRGARNEPAYLIHTAAKLAELLERPLEEVARLTTENAFSAFHIVPQKSCSGEGE